MQGQEITKDFQLYKEYVSSEIFCFVLFFLRITGTSLVAQWLGIRLPMQGTRVQSLVWEDPTCHGATEPMCRNYRACTLEPASHNY